MQDHDALYWKYLPSKTGDQCRDVFDRKRLVFHFYVKSVIMSIIIDSGPSQYTIIFISGES